MTRGSYVWLGLEREPALSDVMIRFDQRSFGNIFVHYFLSFTGRTFHVE